MMKSPKNIFITGATGLLGSNILKQILLQSNSNVNLLIRGVNERKVKQRGHALLEKIYKNRLDNKLLKRINLIRGDIVEHNLGIDDDVFKKLTGRIDDIYHCAAATGFRITLEKARQVNIGGAKNVLELAVKCNNLRKLSYISTAFIIGNKEGVFSEDDIDLGQKFNNAYEQSKFEAELLVREQKNRRFYISVFRPSIIIGDYYTGETTNFKMPYNALRVFSLELLNEVPANINTPLNLISVDVAARAIYILGSNENRDTIYHIISPTNIMSGHFFDSAAEYFGYRNPKFIPIERFDMKRLSNVQFQLISPFIPYFNYKALYTSKKTEAILRTYNFQYPPINESLYTRIFNYCVKVGFIKIKNKSSEVYV